VKASFVDDPSTAVRDADALLGRVMLARGYPVADFEQRSADISVDHSPVLAHYRAAHEIALRDAQGQATTEDLRQAVISSHVLFSELVENLVPVEVVAETPVLVAAQ
jgi:N-acetylglutamate synthase/N-acetylornithine aminotransferase